jgi:hypothetical protein
MSTQCWLVTQKAVLLIVLMLVTGSAVAQDKDVLDLGLELQIYPTGVISGINIGKGFNGKHALHFRRGSPRIRHEGFGVHDDERGDGYGFTLGIAVPCNPGFVVYRWGFEPMSGATNWIGETTLINQMKLAAIRM